MAAFFIIVRHAATARASLYLVYFTITINDDVIRASKVPSVQLSLVDYAPPWVLFPMVTPIVAVAATVSCPHLHRS